MKKSLSKASLRRVVFSALVGALALPFIPLDSAAQYFGRNKVQFDDFEFRVLESDHFDWHYYPEEDEAVMDAVRMGERWYERLARTFQHDFETRKPVILYADHPDFQQTNTLSGFIGEGTGGVTESLKNRVIMPLTGSYWDTDHVLGHELVHAFQYNIAQSRRGGGLRGLGSLPLWLIEGMAEYMSVGREDPLTAMWMRDAILRDDLPTIKQMTRESRFFPYRFGQGLWAYIGGTYGDDAVVQVYRRALRVGFENAIQGVLAMPTDTLSARWKESVAELYLPFMEGRQDPADAGKLILAPSTGSGSVNISPALSPDGRFVAFLSEKDLFSVDLYMANAETGEIIRKLSSANSDPHIDALRFIDSSGTWSPDSRFFAYVVVAQGDNQLIVVSSENGAVQRRISFSDRDNGPTAITNPAWSPDGRYMAFSGTRGGISDLYLYDLEADALTRLTDDKFADLQPSWSPDGSTIAFTSDRGPETNFETLAYSQFQISTIDVETGAVRVLPVFGNVKHINPQFSGDGESLYFISDQDGVSDIYELDLDNGAVRRITNLKTGVSGHTYLSPALSVASNGTAAFTVFDEMEFHIYTRPLDEGVVVAIDDEEFKPGRYLAPASPDRFSRVAAYLEDPNTGLLPSGTYEPEQGEDYSAGLSLDYVGQPTVGVGTDSYGNYIGGATSAYFSDMLGNKILGVAVQANGTFKDIGGQAFYADQSNRINWILSGGRIPYLLGNYVFGSDDAGPYIGLQRLRIFITTAQGQIQYPFSTTERLEFGLGVNRYSYDIELDKFYTNAFGQTIGFDREQLDAPNAVNLAQTSIALVGDNAFFGFVSPIRGGRYRFEVEQTIGTANFATIIGDFRRYYAPHKNLTIGVRGLHYGRYGLTVDEAVRDGFGLFNPLFLGYETFIRGYAWESFSAAECDAGATTSNTCPTLNRLYGNRLAVGSVEARIPFIGVEQLGLINFPFLPTELVAFADAGLAWDNPFIGDDPVLEWSTSSTARVPVVSMGLSARVNVLGFLILETYYAYPFQRPDKGWHWGFNLAPGW
ncbi:MAG: peptidase S9 [Gemmatimonadota bacterium]|nr:peptidase S9 [Gemmatimonadota bacterium]